MLALPHIMIDPIVNALPVPIARRMTLDGDANDAEERTGAKSSPLLTTVARARLLSTPDSRPTVAIEVKTADAIGGRVDIGAPVPVAMATPVTIVFP